jgi:hypothetical protein
LRITETGDRTLQCGTQVITLVFLDDDAGTRTQVIA